MIHKSVELISEWQFNDLNQESTLTETEDFIYQRVLVSVFERMERVGVK
jgi:hypothetical protein